MAKQRVEPFDDTFFWPAVGMTCASLVVLLGLGGLSELLDSKLLSWVALLLAGGLFAPCAGMLIGAETCKPGDCSVERSTHGFLIGCGALGGSIAAAIELAVKLG